MTMKKSTEIMVPGRSARRGLGLTSLMLLASASFLAGCGGMLNDAPSSSPLTGSGLQGMVHGGQYPVGQSTVTLWDASTGSGYGAAASVLSTTTSSGLGGPSGGGNFTLPGYTCPNANDQLYITAVGGNSTGSGANPNLALVAALGSCSNVKNNVAFITINELTTVAAAFALEGFATDYAHIGTSSTNTVGLANAMATASNLVNFATGTALSVTPAYATLAGGTDRLSFNSTVPTNEINTLGNILAYCVNTAGGSLCNTLFNSGHTSTTTGGVSGTPDTFQAALNIAKHPAQNVSAINVLNQGTTPFSPTLGSAPNDWTIALNFIGGGLGGDYTQANQGLNTGIAIDPSGNVWTAETVNLSATELSPIGAPLSPNNADDGVNFGGYLLPGTKHPRALASDTSGHIWVVEQNNSVFELSQSGALIGNFTGVQGLSASQGSFALAIDGSNNVWIPNGSNSDIVKLNSSGVVQSGSTGFTGSGTLAHPGSVAIDGSGHVWTDNDQQAVEMDTNGNVLNHTSANVIGGVQTNYVAIDGSGEFLSPQANPDSTIQIFANSNANLTSTIQGVNWLSQPLGIEVDGLGNYWVINNGNQSGRVQTPELAETNSSGASLSGNNGYFGNIGGPAGLGIDQAGNVWVADNLNTAVVEFVGVAAPSYAPLASAVAANAIGTRP